MSSPLKLTGVVLRTVDCGESDRMVTLLTAERGVMTTFARAARASRRRFGGALEPFTLVTAEARERGPERTATLESVSVVRGLGGIRGDLARIACASYACELARALVRDAEPHPELLALLVDYLTLLDAGPAHPSTLRAFELGALGATGLQPRLGDCARCGRTPGVQGVRGAPEGGAGRLRLDPAAGGVLCESCALTASPRAPALAPATLVELVRLQQGGLAAAEAGPLSAAAGAEARDALTAFVEHQLGRKLASRRFLDEVAPLLR